MVLKKFLLEPYLNNRYLDGVAAGKAEVREEARRKGREEGLREGREEGRQRGNKEWRAWYDRMKEAEARGEEFDELPPGYDQSWAKG